MKKELLYWAAGSAIYFAWFYGVVGGRAEHFGLWVLAVPVVLERADAAFPEKHQRLAVLLVCCTTRCASPRTGRSMPSTSKICTISINAGSASRTTLLTLNEWCALHTRPSLDLLAGAFYISWVPLPMLFAAWLYWRDRALFLRFSWCFFVVNLIGFAIYYLYPAAPPWYVAENGFGSHSMCRARLPG